MTGARISRRAVLKAGASLTFVVAVGPWAPKAVAAKKQEVEIGAWVRIGTDGEILIYGPAAEMGQGTMTALPVIIAEEMDADWSRVRIEHSPVIPEIYGRPGWRGGNSMLTVGSQAVRGYYTTLRVAGAQIRRVLIDNVARRWNVSAGELATSASNVIHTKSGRNIGYGEIVEFAVLPDSLPEIDESQLKSPADFRIVGQSVPRHDIPAKVDGSADYAIDIQLPGMLHGVITRSPVHNGMPMSFNESEVRALQGVVATVKLEHGIGVIAESVEDAFSAKKALVIEWAEGTQAEAFDSETSLEGYAKVPGSLNASVQPMVSTGDAGAGLKQAAKRYSADYYADYVHHAHMEPLNAVVSVSESGESAEAWAGTQNTSGARSAIANTLGIPFEKVDFHPCYLGGAFGRRQNSDYVIEATQLSNAVRRPVKLTWTREDDIQYGMFRPMNLQRMEAGVDDKGRITSWKHCIVGDGGGLLASGIEIPFYDIPNQQIEAYSVSHGIRLGYWRAVGHGFNKFAIEAFIDEIAVDQGQEPYAFRRALLSTSRAKHVLDTVAEMAGWGEELPAGRARGMAFAEHSGSLAAGVAEISLDELTGEIRVHRFWAAVDGGVIVQPDNASAQIEGSIVMGLSSALYERITLKDGLVQQSNYHDYRIMRMSEAPEIDVTFIDSDERPTGLGEPGVPITAGAVANAFATLTGKRLRHMPFTPDRIRGVLESESMS